MSMPSVLTVPSYASRALPLADVKMQLSCRCPETIMPTPGDMLQVSVPTLVRPASWAVAVMMVRASARAAHAVTRLFSVFLFMGGPPSTHSDGPSTRTDIAMFLFLARAKPKDGLSAGPVSARDTLIGVSRGPQAALSLIGVGQKAFF